MGYDPKPVRFTGICTDCLDEFEVVSTTGRVNICQPCIAARSRAILSGDVPAEHLFPVPGFEVSCGNRDEPISHAWVELGTDPRHFDDGFIVEAKVFACMNCGRDKMKDARPKPKKYVPPPMDPEVKAKRDELRRSMFNMQIVGKARDEMLAEFDRQHNVGLNPVGLRQSLAVANSQKGNHMQEVIAIPATNLRKGMQTFYRDARSGKFKRDVRLGDPFTTSGPARLQPIAFTALGADGKRTGTVVYSSCATVLVGPAPGKRR